MAVAGFALMAKGWKSQSDEWAAPLFWIVSAILAVVSYFTLLIRLLPLPRQSDAPELVDLPDKTPSPLTALAQAQTNKKGVMSELPARKRPRAAREGDQRTSDYGQRWNYGYGAWDSNRAWSGPHKMSGGPKTSF
jgi:hypothetical protein